MNAGDGKPQYFLRLYQVPQVGLRIKPAEIAGQSLIEWAEILFPSFIVNVDHPAGGEQHRVPAVARRHYAVEHVHAV